MIKLIVFDLDSTLAEIAKGIRPETLERLKTFENRGIQIAICSGKPTFYLCGIMRQAELSNPILVGENGAVIQFGVDLPPVRYDVQPYSKEAKRTIRFLREKIEEILPDMWFQPNEVVLTPFPAKKEEFDIINRCLEEYHDHVNDVLIYEHFDCFDIIPNGITKKSGIERLAAMVGVLAEEVIAVGDGINDYPMFEFAGISLGINVKDSGKVDKNFSSIMEALDYIEEIYDK